MGQLNSWLQTLRDVYRYHIEELDSISDNKKKVDRLVELNVVEQCINITKIDHVQRAWYKTGHPTIHGLIFDVRTGKLIDMDFKMKQVFEDFRKIYDLKPLKKQTA
jgi:carbonic anhydrase